MLIDTSLTIAYECSHCGSYKFYNISLFELKSKGEEFFNCSCGNTSMHAALKKSRHLEIDVPCIGCGKNHLLRPAFRDIFINEAYVAGCVSTGIQYCFIGNDKKVRMLVDKLEMELDRLMDELGYESCFKNSRVMFDSLNAIHDKAEQGELFCLCGSGDIEIQLLWDRILLKCRKCSHSRVIFAASNEDLKDILQDKKMLLS